MRQPKWSGLIKSLFKNCVFLAAVEDIKAKQALLKVTQIH